MRRARLAENDRVKIIDRTSQHFGNTGTLIKIFQEPVRMRLEYRCLVKIDDVGEEIFAPQQLEKITPPVQ